MYINQTNGDIMNLIKTNAGLPANVFVYMVRVVDNKYVTLDYLFSNNNEQVTDMYKPGRIEEMHVSEIEQLTDDDMRNFVDYFG